MSKSIGIKSLNPKNKYILAPTVDLPQRNWPNKQLKQCPIWCSVDLRDGNQALINPMNIQLKLKMFKLLTEIGFKEIEIGFPAASDTEYQFTRKLIDDDLIPDDVIPQVLCQAREHLIVKTFESLKGCKKAIFHLYNSTSILQRKVVFKKEKQEIIEIATEATKLIKKIANDFETEIIFQYSPESFTGTELDFSKEICEAVMDCWQPKKDKKMILNLPATVEMNTPNVYADMIEWCIDNFKNRDNYLLSLHTHNDRGTGVAATELALLAGADRVEGTLFGNGERTGNVDIVTLALNLYSQGIDPQLDLKDILSIRKVAEECTEIKVNERHPYAGDLVFTAFSGSHQDAIKKGMDALKENNQEGWEVPYLAIDPLDIGRTYEAIIRINSQSGKGGVAYILEREFNCDLPKSMHPEVSKVIQVLSDKTSKEVTSNEIWEEFNKEFVNLKKPIEYLNFFTTPSAEGPDIVNACLTINDAGIEKILTGTGNGPISACKSIIENSLGIIIDLLHFSEHALEQSSEAKAITYIQIFNHNTNKTTFGVGIDSNIEKSSIRALISAVNRSF